MKARRRDPGSAYANLNWTQLRARPNLGLKIIRDLVQMFAIAARG